jgi:hypothetical protein
VTEHAVAANAAAIRNLAARLERMGYEGDCHAEAEHIALNLLADGYRPLEPPPTPRGPGSTEAGREAARRIYDQTRREKENH